MKEKPIWRKEWIWRIVFVLVVAFANQLESAGQWDEVNWATMVSALVLAVAREFTKTSQDRAKILGGK